MKNTINQLQKGISKLQSIIEEMSDNRKQFRVKEQVINESDKALYSMVKDNRSLNEIIDDIEKSVMKRSSNYEIALNELKEGRLV
ncbi:hypothetical protein J7E51_04440 [Priestia megaterium]|nr:hypothetical protein [Priestia megaterium]